MPANLLKLALAAAVALLFLCSLVAGYIQTQLLVPVAKDSIFIIASGSNLSVITKRLTEDDLLPVNKIAFKAFALLTRDAGAIQAGQYQLKAGMPSQDVLALFRSGEVIRYRITFPEGLRVKDWLVRLQGAPYLEAKTRAMTRDEIGQSLGLTTELEGSLFPDTYQYTLGDSDLDVLKLAVREMSKVLGDEWHRRGMTSISSPFDALILASMIEKETGYGPDREKIASVFHNRLNIDMKLQSDPTVIFGLGSDFDGDLKRSHLKSDTPYNTYTRKGLPPGPICSPGRASINAALGGSSHPYFYFVAMGNGKSYFSVTLKEHNNAVNRYQKKQKQ
tara:strand:+ start:4458 stop:5459 length:1002 start_codon:yes stop_codon:yes gene_type:complete